MPRPRQRSCLRGFRVEAYRRAYRRFAAITEFNRPDRDNAYDAALRAVEISLIAEARLGELLKAQIKHEGGRPSKNSNNDVTFLSDIGLSRMDSRRAQRLAETEELKGISSQRQAKHRENIL